ncbi:hypothetical protein [Methanobacterium sp.]|uniref:hypothetical protein n=1 Tax=Methanobacterium sp. TaxID=2164 RepID=UPI003C7487B1
MTEENTEKNKENLEESEKEIEVELDEQIINSIDTEQAQSPDALKRKNKKRR